MDNIKKIYREKIFYVNYPNLVFERVVKQMKFIFDFSAYIVHLVDKHDIVQ